MNKIIKDQVKVLKFDGEMLQEVDDSLAIEYPFTIYIDDEEFATVVCTPKNIKELVIGFLASEGMIRTVDDILSLDIDKNRGFAYVSLKVKQTISKEFYAKRMIGSCCGKSRQFYFHNDAITAKTIMTRQSITVQQSIHLMNMLHANSEDFQQTGGVHNAALCTVDEMLFSYSDIGRHNALDKIFGHCLINKIPLKDKVIVFSGRISSEVVLKIAKIGAGILISKSAPTSLGIELAEDLGITAIGFVRKGQLNIYSHPDRVIETQELIPN